MSVRQVTPRTALFKRSLRGSHAFCRSCEPLLHRDDQSALRQFSRTDRVEDDNADLTDSDGPGLLAAALGAGRNRPPRRTHLARHRARAQPGSDELGLRVDEPQTRLPSATNVEARHRGGLLFSGVCRPGSTRCYFSSSGTLPPLAATLIITCLCSQTFIFAESLVSPV
jgi:hypothetical protein